MVPLTNLRIDGGLLESVTLVVAFGILPQNFGRLTRAQITWHIDGIYYVTCSGCGQAGATVVKISQHLTLFLFFLTFITLFVSTDSNRQMSNRFSRCSFRARSGIVTEGLPCGCAQ